MGRPHLVALWRWSAAAPGLPSWTYHFHSQSASLILRPVDLNSSPHSQGTSIRPPSGQLAQHLERFGITGQRSPLCSVSVSPLAPLAKSTKNKLLNYFLSALPVHQVQNQKGEKKQLPQTVRKLWESLFCITEPAYVLNCNPRSWDGGEYLMCLPRFPAAGFHATCVNVCLRLM